MNDYQRKKTCPKCRFEEAADATSCRQCGIVFDKYDPFRGEGSSRPAPPARSSGSSFKTAGPSRSINLGPILLVVLAAAAAAWFLLQKPYELVGAEPTSGGPVVIFMHGYGAPGDDLVRAAESIGTEAPTTSFVVLEAPHSRGLGRAWMVGGSRAEMMEQAAESRQRILETVDELVKDGVAPDNIYLGGFSQGAQMALDVGFGAETRHRIGGLVLIGGGYPNWPESVGSQALGESQLAPGARALVVHGRSDSVVSFSQGESVSRDLRSKVATEWAPVDGGHNISPGAELAVAEFLNAH